MQFLKCLSVVPFVKMIQHCVLSICNNRRDSQTPLVTTYLWKFTESTKLNINLDKSSDASDFSLQEILSNSICKRISLETSSTQLEEKKLHNFIKRRKSLISTWRMSCQIRFFIETGLNFVWFMSL